MGVGCSNNPTAFLHPIPFTLFSLRLCERFLCDIEMRHDINQSRLTMGFAALLTMLFLSACSSQTAMNNQASTSNAASSPTRLMTQPTRDATNGPPQDEITGGPEDDVLIDYRSELNLDEPKLQPQEQQRILKAVYGTDFQSRNPVINSARQGSFTAPKVKETVYLTQKGGPVALDPESLKGTTLAVFNGNRLVTRLDATEFNFILRLSDLNQDGVNELLLQGSSYNMGTLVSWARLVELKDGRLQVVKDFGRLEQETCGSGDGSGEIVAGIVRHTLPAQGKWPEFSIKYYRAPCPSESEKRNPKSFREAPDAKIEK